MAYTRILGESSSRHEWRYVWRAPIDYVVLVEVFQSQYEFRNVKTCPVFAKFGLSLQVPE